MFLLKKIVSQFFSPLSLTLEMFLLGLFLLYFTSRQKAGRTLVLIAVFFLAFCSYTPTANLLIGPLISQFPSYRYNNSLTMDQMPKLVVVLGAGHSNDSSLPVLSRMGYDSLSRLIEGIRIYRMIPECKLLLSGGSKPGTISSAQDMAQLAKELGVIEKDIIVESESRDTKDEAQIISSIAGAEPFVLVTSSSHMRRSMALFRKEGMNPVPAPTRSLEERIYSRTPDPFFPSSVNLDKAEMAFHEYLGIAWAALRNQI